MLTEERFIPSENSHSSDDLVSWLDTLTVDEKNKAHAMYTYLTSDLHGNDYVTRVVRRRIGIACGFYPPFWPLNPERE